MQAICGEAIALQLLSCSCTLAGPPRPPYTAVTSDGHTDVQRCKPKDTLEQLQAFGVCLVLHVSSRELFQVL